MSDEPIEPPDPELRRLFEAESRAPDEPAAMKARVWSGVRNSLGGPRPGSGGGGGGIPVSAVALVAFVVGAGAGAGVYHLAAPPPASAPAAVERPAEPMHPDAGDVAPAALTAEPPPSEAPPDSAAPAEPRPPDAGPAPERRRSPRAAATHEGALDRGWSDAPDREAEAAASESTLARERALVDVARAALARGETAASLDAIERHARAFPDGRLVEEREALRVLTLAGAGRMTEARRAADRFRQRHPRSLLQRPIDAALGARP